MASRKYEKLKKQKDAAISDIKNETVKLEVVSEEAKRVSEVSRNVSIILGDLDKQFEQATKLTGIDISFLFFATALQCIRQYFLTPFQSIFHHNLYLLITLYIFWERLRMMKVMNIYYTNMILKQEFRKKSRN
ncbi:MAG: hypothetical protein HFG83_02395 [Dorea sp.]|nr:hypothetical protein [Dorea sp.]